MPQFSVAEAARATGKDRSTIHRHIKDGRLTATRDATGRIVIEMSELARAFGELLADGQKPQTPTAVQEDGLREAVNALREQLQAAQGRETAAQEREMWLKDQLEAAQARIMELERRLMPLALPEKSGFFARFFGKQHRGKCVI